MKGIRISRFIHTILLHPRAPFTEFNSGKYMFTFVAYRFIEVCVKYLKGPK